MHFSKISLLKCKHIGCRALRLSVYKHTQSVWMQTGLSHWLSRTLSSPNAIDLESRDTSELYQREQLPVRGQASPHRRSSRIGWTTPWFYRKEEEGQRTQPAQGQASTSDRVGIAAQSSWFQSRAPPIIPHCLIALGLQMTEASQSQVGRTRKIVLYTNEHFSAGEAGKEPRMAEPLNKAIGIIVLIHRTKLA